MSGKAGTVVIVGGAIMGSCTAYFLKQQGFGGRVLVIERDPSYQKSSTALSAAAIRTQFGCDINTRITLFAADVFHNIKDWFKDKGSVKDNLRIRGRCSFQPELNYTDPLSAGFRIKLHRPLIRCSITDDDYNAVLNAKLRNRAQPYLRCSGNRPGIQRGASLAGNVMCSGALDDSDVTTPWPTRPDTMRLAVRALTPSNSATSLRGSSPR